jgi:hypothetical protein
MAGVCRALVKSTPTILKVVAPIAVGAWAGWKTYRVVSSLRRQEQDWKKLEGLAYLIDNVDVDLQDCIEVVRHVVPVITKEESEGGAKAEIPKGLRKNKIRRGKKKVYACLVAKTVRAQYPNLGEGRVDREIARRKATAIMAEHGMRPTQICEVMHMVEAMVFMKSAGELSYSELKQCWWWAWTDRGLKPSRSA